MKKFKFSSFCELICGPNFGAFYKEIVKYQFFHQRNPNLSAIRCFIQFRFELELQHSLWGDITISEQSGWLCKSYERRVFILKKNF